MESAVNICPTCGKAYKTVERYKLHLAKGHIKDTRVYKVNKEHLGSLLEKTVKKIAENKCFPSATRTEISGSFAKELSTVQLFVNSNWKVLKKGKLEKFYGKFYAKVVLQNNVIFPSLSGNASTLILTKLTDIIVSDFKSWFHEKATIDDKPLALAENEIYGLQYIGGYVIHKLHNRLKYKKGDKDLMEILHGCRGDANDLADQRMIAALNRGGLWCINEKLQSILHTVELKFRKMMSEHKKVVNFEKFILDSMKDPSIIMSYQSLNLSDHSEEQMKTALHLILDLYVKVRMHSFARKKTEEAKMLKVQSKKGLRTELKRYENPIDIELPE